MTELKKCPFCGASAEIKWDSWREISPTSGVYRLSVIHERNCFFSQMCGLHLLSEMTANNKDDLIEAWNRRVEE